MTNPTYLKMAEHKLPQPDHPGDADGCDQGTDDIAIPPNKANEINKPRGDEKDVEKDAVKDDTEKGQASTNNVAPARPFALAFIILALCCAVFLVALYDNHATKSTWNVS